MSGQNKMIIITTNEDIIKQFQLKQNEDTQIFHLENNQMDLPFLKTVRLTQKNEKKNHKTVISFLEFNKF